MMLLPVGNNTAFAPPSSRNFVVPAPETTTPKAPITSTSSGNRESTRTTLLVSTARPSTPSTKGLSFTIAPSSTTIDPSGTTTASSVVTTDSSAIADADLPPTPSPASDLLLTADSAINPVMNSSADSSASQVVSIFDPIRNFSETLPPVRVNVRWFPSLEALNNWTASSTPPPFSQNGLSGQSASSNVSQEKDQDLSSVHSPRPVTENEVSIVLFFFFLLLVNYLWLLIKIFYFILFLIFSHICSRRASFC